MFIRIAWDRKSIPARPVGGRDDLRRIALSGHRECDDLGIPPRDFDKMTRSLFDRQD
ncbi:hypothetical protein [Pelagibacterium xiamenense]|uniref:hypothetical protein n=1 Tax=Pelagibacterium xiamenense TaxID=2901140 RepID=UPI001E5D62FA|nr:hypothetical protein [Pelagibacterium xiamenense]MCD7060948.1 hypothetical protein [Pelagibacterium xiamenense]